LHCLVLAEQQADADAREGDADTSCVQPRARGLVRIAGMRVRMTQRPEGRAPGVHIAGGGVQLGEEQRDAARAAVQIRAERRVVDDRLAVGSLVGQRANPVAAPIVPERRFADAPADPIGRDEIRAHSA